MAIEIKVPGLPESVSDATVVAWRKQVGDTVKRDESLVDLETDKVVLEVPSPADGVIVKISEEEGTVVIAGQLLATLKESSSTDSVKASEKPSSSKVVDESEGEKIKHEQLGYKSSHQDDFHV